MQRANGRADAGSSKPKVQSSREAPVFKLQTQVLSGPSIPSRKSRFLASDREAGRLGARSVPLRSVSTSTISSELFHGAWACVAAAAWDICQRPTLNPAGTRPLGRFRLSTFPLPGYSSETQGCLTWKRRKRGGPFACATATLTITASDKPLSSCQRLRCARFPKPKRVWRLAYRPTIWDWVPGAYFELCALNFKLAPVHALGCALS